MITVDVKPEGKRKVVLTFEDKENDIGVVEVIKCMAHSHACCESKGQSEGA